MGVEMTALVNGACGLISHGMKIFPVHFPIECDGRLQCSCRDACMSPAKHPYGRHVETGLREASTDAARLEYWWSAGAAVNIGRRPTGEGDRSSIARSPPGFTWRWHGQSVGKDELAVRLRDKRWP